MASGIDWFRWHHGSITDPKFQLVAKKANAKFGDVIAVWAFILEMASSDADRGNISAVDFEALDYMLGAEDGTSIRILDAMTQRGLIYANRVASWEKRQPKRERSEDNSTDRVRAFREKQRHETPCNTNENQETPREEKRREEVNHGADKPPRKKATTIPADFYPNENGVAYAEEKRISLAVELESFRNWHLAKGGTFKDWQACWRTWCDKAVEFGRSGKQAASASSAQNPIFAGAI